MCLNGTSCLVPKLHVHNSILRGLFNMHIPGPLSQIPLVIPSFQLSPNFPGDSDGGSKKLL